MEENDAPLDTSPLAKGVPPPPDLEDRVVAELRRRRLIHDRPRLRWWIAAAAALVLFAAGFGLGRHRGTSHSQFTFVLLLREGPGWREAASPAEELQRVSEYKAWAGRWRANGLEIDGTKLGDRVETLSEKNASTVNDPDKIGGFFAIHAADLEAARAIARTCPHLTHGGRIEVRQIEGT